MVYQIRLDLAQLIELCLAFDGVEATGSVKIKIWVSKILEFFSVRTVPEIVGEFAGVGALFEYLLSCSVSSFELMQMTFKRRL